MVFEQIEKYVNQNDIIIEGETRGVDQIAKQYAINHDMDYESHPAQWDIYGRSAGYIRNEEMVKLCDKALIIWDGESRGTKHDIDLCKKYEKPYKLIKI